MRISLNIQFSVCLQSGKAKETQEGQDPRARGPIGEEAEEGDMETEPIPAEERIVLKRELYTDSHLTDNYESTKYRKTVPETFKSVGSRITPKCIGLQLLSYLPIVRSVLICLIAYLGRVHQVSPDRP
jgi:hypothetical protein